MTAPAMRSLRITGRITAPSRQSTAGTRSLISSNGISALPGLSRCGRPMIDAAIVGLGRWGRTLVAAVQGKSDGLRFTRAVSRNPDKLRDDAARYRLDLVSELDAVLRDP